MKLLKVILLGTVDQINTGDYGSVRLIYLLRGILGGYLLALYTITIIAPKYQDEVWHHWAFWLVNGLFGAAFCHIIWFIWAIYLICSITGIWNDVKEFGTTIIVAIIALLIMFFNFVSNSIKKI